MSSCVSNFLFIFFVPGFLEYPTSWVNSISLRNYLVVRTVVSLFQSFICLQFLLLFLRIFFLAGNQITQIFPMRSFSHFDDKELGNISLSFGFVFEVCRADFNIFPGTLSHLLGSLK